MNKNTAIDNILEYVEQAMDDQYEGSEWDEPDIKEWKEKMDTSIEIIKGLKNV